MSGRAICTGVDSPRARVVDEREVFGLKPVNEVRGLRVIRTGVRDDVVACWSGHRGRRGFHRRRTHEGLARQLAEHTPIVVGETRQIP